MSEDIGISHTIYGVYNEDDNVYADRKTKVESGDTGGTPVRPDDRAERFTP